MAPQESAEVTDRRPVLAICRNQLEGARPEECQRVGVGRSLLSLREAEGAALRGNVLCFYNGRLLSRLTLAQRLEVSAIEDDGRDASEAFTAYAMRADNWRETLTTVDDTVLFEELASGAAVRIVLGLAIAAVGAYADIFTAGASTFLVQFGLSLALGGIIQLLTAPRTPNNGQIPTGLGVYSSALSGNQASLDTPIWKACGRPKLTPNFAAQPYIEFRPRNSLEPTIDSDQFFYALLAVSCGSDAVENAFIGKTRIGHFLDVERANYLAPGVAPSVVNPAVVTSDEVAGALQLDAGVEVGPFAACRPGDTCYAIGIDVGADQGLGRIDSGGSSQTITATWQVQARAIDHYGAPLSDWTTLGAPSRTADINSAQRWTETYTLSSPIRPEVRLGRTNNPNTDSSARDSIQWIGMRGFLTRPAPLNPNVGHFEIVMRSSEQLNQITQKDFSLILRCSVPTLDGTLTRQPASFSRNPAWWLLELWTNAIWGEGLPDTRVDLQAIYDLAQVCDARQDHFDYAFTSAMDSWEAAQLIARTARARCFRRNGLYTVARDELADIAVAALTPRIAQPQSMTMTTTLPKREQADGYVVQYLSNVTWDTESIDCPCPGYSAQSPDEIMWDAGLPAMANPIVVVLEGITGEMHALREGLYHSADLAYRTSTVAAKVEMEAVILSVLDAVRWLPQIHGYGIAGDVAFWDAASRTVGLSEPADFTGASPFITFVRDDGSLTTAVAVTAGPTAYDVVLPAAPDFSIVTDDGTRERTKFLLGAESSGDELCKIKSIGDGGKTQSGAQLFDVVALIDDDRVHTRDVPYLPAAGETQDPINDGLPPADVPFAAIINIDALRNRQYKNGVAVAGLDPDAVYSLSMPSGQRFDGWSEWASDADPFVTHTGLAWGNSFKVTSDLGVGGTAFGAMSIASTGDAARLLFSGGTLTGSTSWTFWFDSDSINDNRGGLSIQITKD